MPHFNLKLVAWLMAALPWTGVRAEPAVPVEFEAKAAPELDALFQRETGWIGADGIYSVELSPGRRLWLFSDTWIGEIRDGRRVHPGMINNSIGLQTRAGVELYYPNPDGKAGSFIKPVDGRGFYWLFAGTRTEAGLFLFLRQVEIYKPGAVFGFRSIGSRMGQVSNPDEHPSQWKVRQLDFPFGKYEPDERISLGAAILNTPEFIYIYGMDSRDKRRDLIVARVAPRDFAAFDRWQFLGGGKWQDDFLEVTGICPDMASELSVSWQPALECYVLIYTEGGMFGKIMMRRSPGPAGPWSEPQVLYHCPEMKWKEKIFCYAAKAHPALAAAPDELVISYASNSLHVPDVIDDARLYFPRFVRVKFQVKSEGGNPNAELRK